MTDLETAIIIADVKRFFDSMTGFSEKALSAAFLECYNNSPDFLAFSNDGIMRHYDEFKQICTGYYDRLKQQRIETIQEKFRVIDKNLVIVGWTGNIVADFKNGDTLKMKGYAVTYLFKRIDNTWKVIHSHESSPPPEFIKKAH